MTSLTSLIICVFATLGVAAAQDAVSMTPGEVTWRIVACCLLVAGSAYCSGLTLAVMGLDVYTLEITSAAGTPKEREYAQKILPVRKKGNQLLACLLWSNMSVNAALSIIMADLTSGAVGFVVSTVVIVLLGEILPQAGCSRYALRVGAFFVPSVQVLLFILYPVSKPIAIVLDYWLGEEVGTIYSKREMASLLSQHVQLNLLHQREAAIMLGAITFRERLVRDVMTPADRVFALKSSDRLDYALLTQIYRTGFSRIPVWDDAQTQIIGVLYAKDLMLLSPAGRTPVGTVVHFFNRHHLNVCDDDDTLEAVLRQFNASRQHFAVVRSVDATAEDRDPAYVVVGVITMQDVMDEIMGEEGRDEYDAMRGGDDDHLAQSATAAHLGASATAPGSPSNSDGTSGHDSPRQREGMALVSVPRSQQQQYQTPLHARSGLAGGRVDAGKSAARVAREQAALRRLREVTENAVAGRGVNNDLTGQEVRGLAAHLILNVAAFRYGGGTAEAPAASALSFDMVERLVRQSDVVDIIAPERVPPSGIRHRPTRNATAANNNSNTDAALVDPTTFGTSAIGWVGVGERAGSSSNPTGSASLPTPSEFPHNPMAPSWLYVRGEPTTVATVVLQGWLAAIAGNDGLRVEVGPWDVLAEGALLTRPAGATAYVPDFSACPISPVVRCLRIRRDDFVAAIAGTLPDLRMLSASSQRDGGGGAGVPTVSAADLVVSQPPTIAPQASVPSSDRSSNNGSAQLAEAPVPFSVFKSREHRSVSDAPLLAAIRQPPDGSASVELLQHPGSQAGGNSGVGANGVADDVAVAIATPIESSPKPSMRLPSRLTTLPVTPFSAAMEAAAPMLALGLAGHAATGPVVVRPNLVVASTPECTNTTPAATQEVRSA